MRRACCECSGYARCFEEAGLAAAEELFGEFAACGEECREGDYEPCGGAGGDDEQLPAVGGDRRKMVGQFVGCDEGQQCGDEGAGEFGVLEVCEADQLLAVEE